MKVFLSWSGDRSKAVATAFREWLPMILQFTKPWMSTQDIGAGARWADRVAGELDGSNFGILFLTPENLDSPWLIFEAGALSKSVTDARVIPLLVGNLTPNDVKQPLAQFQIKTNDREGVYSLLSDMNSAWGAGSLPKDLFDTLFAATWPKLADRLAASELRAPRDVPDRKRDDTDMLKEILTITRGLLEKSRTEEKVVEGLYTVPSRVAGFRFETTGGANMYRGFIHHRFPHLVVSLPRETADGGFVVEVGGVVTAAQRDHVIRYGKIAQRDEKQDLQQAPGVI